MEPKAPINTQSAAYGMGCQAGLADDYLAQKNPYELGSPEYEEWNEGWRWGLRNWDMNQNDGG